MGTGRISSVVLGEYNSLVGGVLNGIVYLVFNGTCLALEAARGRPVSKQLKVVLRRGKKWSELGVWKYLVLAGVSDVINNITGLVAQPYLSTLTFSLMNQACVPFTVCFSMLFLGTRYVAMEAAAVVTGGLAAIGAVFTTSDESGKNDDMFWAVFCAATTSFAAISFVLKEMAFSNFKKDKKGAPMERRLVEVEENSTGTQEMPEDLNLFVASTVVSAVGFVLVMPVGLLSHAIVSSDSVFTSLAKGFGCLFTCNHALAAYSAYASVNVVFNVALLTLTGRASALLSFMSLKLAVPGTAILSSLPWPIIGAKKVAAVQWLVLGVMCCGLLAFRYGNIIRQRRQVATCCWPLLG